SGNGIPGGDFVAEFTLNVQAPVAANLSLSTNEDVPVDGSLSASDANGDTLTYALASLPAKGTVQLNSATGAIRYTPSTNVNGTDSFTFTASDGTNTSNTATVTISIAPVNDAPSASALAFTLQEDQTLITTLSGSDPEGGTLVYLLATTPAKGTLTLSQTPQGQFLYVPQPNVSGTDQFTYRVFDGTTFSNTATVTLDIQPVNDGPVVANQTLATREDEALSGTLTATDVEGQPLRFVLLSNGALGRAVITNATTGAFTYTPDPNAFGTDSFTVIASDGTDDSQVATITVQIAPTNDAPRAVVSSTSGTQVGVNASLELSGAASSDIEGTLAYRWDFGDGTVLSVGPAVVTHAWTSAGVYTVRLTVTDEGGLSDWTSLTVVVAAASGGGGASPPDSDGDGFSDELETALKTDPHSALSTPLENKPLEEVEPLTITKASISLNFIKAGSDTLSFSGTLPVPKDFNPADETVIIDVEGVIESFTLDKRGNSTSATLPHQFKLAVKARKGVVEAQAARYSIRLKRGEFADNFNAEFANGKLEDPVTRNLLFTVLFNGNYYEVLLPMEIQGSRASYKEPGKLRQPN
ncbi:MAG TPA: Ig-like domain-containing protein, partial [Planctomycetota bacterium]|nr:Ig-like domain-containing protein [Planctomycetota bacterium]